MQINLKSGVKLAGAAVLALAIGSAFAQTKTLRLSTPALNDFNHEYYKQFKAGVEAKSGGRLKVDIFPAGQLGPLPRTIEGVTLGTVDMDQPATGFLIGLDPRFVVFDAPGLFDSEEHALRVLRDPEIRKRIATMGESRNIEALLIQPAGPLSMLSHKPVRTVADFKGLKVRAPGGAPMHIEPLRKLGASPITMPLNEVLPQMQNRGLDAMISGFSIITAFKYWDIAKAVTELPGSFLMGLVIASRGNFKALGPELEGLVRSEARRAESVYDNFRAMDMTRVRALWQANGGERIIMSPAESKKYIADATSVLPPILGENTKIREDYDALIAAAKKHRGK